MVDQRMKPTDGTQRMERNGWNATDGTQRMERNGWNGHVVLSPLSIACLRLRQGNGEVEEAEQQQGLCLLV
jgi:hypothetical protein